ncbi:MAG: thiamine diphosphokinase [Candidatus Caldatribacteriota bacterium]
MSKIEVVLALNGCLKKNKEGYKKIIKEEKVRYIAADGGAQLLEELGHTPEVIIGDLDSLTEGQLEYFQKKGVEIIRYPREKDETDGELALQYCKEKGWKEIIIIGFEGGRLDQQLANIFLLEYAHKNGLKALLREPDLEMGLIEKRKIFLHKKGAMLSLLPLDQIVKGVEIFGCRYPLNSEDLFRGKSRGISNIIKQERAIITIQSGLLLYILYY